MLLFARERTSLGRVGAELYVMATRLALVGVCFVAFQRLKPFETLALPDTLRLQGMTKECERVGCVQGSCAAVTMIMMME